MNRPTNSYATDGRCHAAAAGTFGHECGKPATWIGEKVSGFASGFCDRCKNLGIETAGIVTWRPANTTSIDAYTLRHLDQWLDEQIHGDARRETCRRDMLTVIATDPEYWGA